MEVFDVGARPADQVIEALFEGGALKALLRGHGAACFTLVRSMVAPDFYRELIANSSTVDATTRSHVAFVVFYGNRSGIVRERHRYGAHGEIRYGEKLRLDGLSIDRDPDIPSHMVVLPTSADSRQTPGTDELEDFFPPSLNDEVRYSPASVDSHVLAHQMSRVAARLMEKYEIAESELPCLLFTDAVDFERHLVVSLERDDPLESLYRHVLSPLSDGFNALSSFWKRRDGLRCAYSDLERAKERVVGLPHEIEQLVVEEKNQRALLEEQRQSVEAQVEELSQSRAKREAEREALSSHQVGKVKSLRDELQAIADGKRTFRSDAQKAIESARLERNLLREEQRLSGYENSSLTREAREISRLNNTLRSLELEISHLEWRRKNCEEDLARTRVTLETWPPEKLAQESAQIHAMAASLEAEGFDRDKVVRADHPSAFAAIEAMHRTGKLGAHGREPAYKGQKPMRILFLAANPVETTALDLEEELRSLKNELLAVKYRDQVVFTAAHAVRPDDLIRYVRSERPTIVHFSGHGTGVGIVLRNDEGGYMEVTGPSLQRFFSNRGVDLVVLNACHSKAQAELLLGSVKAVVGITDAVDDVAARRFTAAFYRALGNGLTIAEAFRDGGDCVALNNGEDVFWSAGRLDDVLVHRAP
jgi:CHAT domain